jgi:hypothetical protein
MAQQRITGFALIFTGVALISFGITMLFLSAAYARDLLFLVTAPLELWSSLCGRPSSDPITLPLLVTVSGIALLVGIVLLAVTLVRRLNFIGR